jgi:hypothetical protein
VFSRITFFLPLRVSNKKFPGDVAAQIILTQQTAQAATLAYLSEREQGGVD